MNSENMEKNGNIVTGTIGAFIGALIATIPWILMYVQGGMILSVLAVIVAAGALFGYKKLNGVIDKRLPIIISAASILSIVFATLLIIPLLLLKKEGFDMSIDNLKLLYENEEFISAIIKDLIVSILFTILGIAGIISNTKKQIENNEEVKIDFNNNVNTNMNDNIEEARKAFTKLNAMNKENAVSKEEILNALESDNKNHIFNSLKLAQIIKKYKGKYYFSETCANSAFKRFLVLYAKIMVWIVIFTILFIILCI